MKNWKTGLSVFATIGISLFVLAQVLLIGFKLTGVLVASWWIVLLPTIIVAGLLSITAIVYAILIAIASAYMDEEMREMN